MMGIPDQREAVANLVHLRTSLDVAVPAVRQFPWDSEEELVTLGPTELRHVLELFLDEALSAEQLEAWANAVEGRDDIEFAPQDMIDLITEVANPLLYSPLTPSSARDLLRRVTTLKETEN